MPRLLPKSPLPGQAFSRRRLALHTRAWRHHASSSHLLPLPQREEHLMQHFWRSHLAVPKWPSSHQVMRQGNGSSPTTFPRPSPLPRIHPRPNESQPFLSPLNNQIRISGLGPFNAFCVLIQAGTAYKMLPEVKQQGQPFCYLHVCSSRFNNAGLLLCTTARQGIHKQ